MPAQGGPEAAPRASAARSPAAGRTPGSICRRRIAVASARRRGRRSGTPAGLRRLLGGLGLLLAGARRERAAAYPVQTRVQVVRLLQVDLDRSHEGVALLLRVVAHHAGQLIAELPRVGAEALEVRRAQLHDEVVGDDGPLAVPDRRVVVALALEGAGDLDGLDLGLEHLGEGAVDQTLETLLELLQDSHGAPPPSFSSWYCLLIVSTHREIGWFPLSARSMSVDPHSWIVEGVPGQCPARGGGAGRGRGRWGCGAWGRRRDRRCGRGRRSGCGVGALWGGVDPLQRASDGRRSTGGPLSECSGLLADRIGCEVSGGGPAQQVPTKTDVNPPSAAC